MSGLWKREWEWKWEWNLKWKLRSEPSRLCRTRCGRKMEGKYYVCIWQREPNSMTHCKLDVHTRNTVREGCHVFIPHPSLSHMDGPHPDPPFTCRPMRRYQRRAEVHRQAYDEREVMAQVTCR
jgi:hypothetical protein